MLESHEAAGVTFPTCNFKVEKIFYLQLHDFNVLYIYIYTLRMYVMYVHFDPISSRSKVPIFRLLRNALKARERDDWDRKSNNKNYFAELFLYVAAIFLKSLIIS